MYYYLSFLRPPPHTSHPTAPITFTPQVSNDLRTEAYPVSIDIFYHWVSHTPSSDPTTLTVPVKLTTWRQANAYKELSIPPPPRTSKGREVGGDLEACLILSVQPTSDAPIIDMRDSKVGSIPLPVSSLPIKFAAKPPSGKAAKQEAIVRSFRLLGDDAPVLRVKEMTSFDLDKKLWDSGIGLSAWLTRLSASSETSQDHHLVQKLRTLLFDSDKCDILELGAGTGMVSLVLAALRSSRPTPDESIRETRILSTDLPSSIELMAHNIHVNVGLFPTAPPVAITLDWDADLPAEVRAIASFDVIVMADVTYNTTSFPALTRALSAVRALASSPRGPPVVLMAYKERDLAERALWGMLAQEAGLVLERVGRHPGAGGQEVEIWAGI